MGSFGLAQWLVIAAVVVLAFGAAGSLPRMLRDLRRGFGESGQNAAEPITAHASWTTICVLLAVAIAVVAASALLNGTWAG